MLTKAPPSSPPARPPEAPLQAPPREARPRHVPPHLAPPLPRRRGLPDNLRAEPDALEPRPPLHLPLLPGAPHGTRRPLPVRQGPLGPRPRVLLHRRALLHARVLHERGLPPARAPRRAAPLQAGPLHGADVHGAVLRALGPRRDVRYEPHPRLVLQHPRHVRRVPAPQPGGCRQVLLPLPGRVLVAAGRRAGAGHGEASQGL